MTPLRFPNQLHPFAGRSVEEARYDEITFIRRARLNRRFGYGKSWASWFANRVAVRRIREGVW